MVTGRFLLSRKWSKNWPFILYISLLALVMIASSHSAEKKVHRAAQLRNQVKELNSEFIDTRAKLMQESLKYKVVEKAQELGLEKSQKPPIKINRKEE